MQNEVVKRRVNNLTAQLRTFNQQPESMQVVECKADAPSKYHGGDMVAFALKEQGVEMLFTLTGGHIAPILVGANKAGIRVVDVRDEATTVFAADAAARLSGIPGVAVVTAGPGLTNTITAVKNAQMAQSPVVVFAGATAMLLKGRGSLQDIDQFALMRPHVKLMSTIKSVRDIIPTIRTSFRVAQQGVPGPVFIEFPLEVLWPLETISEMLAISTQAPPLKLTKASLMANAQSLYIKRHIANVFRDSQVIPKKLTNIRPALMPPNANQVSEVAQALTQATKPVLVLGSQSVRPQLVAKIIAALTKIGAPVFLSGMGRGLLGANHPLQMRHKRGNALGKADFVLLCGVPADFRLDYGRHVNKSAYFATVNLCPETLKKNNDVHKPTVLAHSDPALFLIELAANVNDNNLSKKWGEWFKFLNSLQEKREQEINKMAVSTSPNFVNPLQLCREIDAALDENSIMVADGGDFVGTASYICRPRGPLTWLDPGVFGTLGVGGGFAMGAKLVRPSAEVWILYGDGSVGWSLSEFDTYVRHKLPVIAVVGNDACWSQMYRDQIRLLKDPVATELAYTHYEEVAKGFGAEGILVRTNEEIAPALKKAKELAKQGKPVLVNVLIAKSTFREGSISL